MVDSGSNIASLSCFWHWEHRIRLFLILYLKCRLYLPIILSIMQKKWFGVFHLFLTAAAILVAIVIAVRISDRSLYEGALLRIFFGTASVWFCYQAVVVRIGDMESVNSVRVFSSDFDNPLVDCSCDGWNRLDLWACVEKRKQWKRKMTGNGCFQFYS